MKPRYSRHRLLLMFFFAWSIDSHAATWTSTTVHEEPYFGLNRNSQVVDDSGNSHIYYGGRHLYHKYKDQNDSWNEEVVDNSPQVGRYAIAERDQNGNHHLLYSDQFSSAPYGSGHVSGTKYAYGSTGNWTIETTSIPPEAFNRNVFGGDKSLGIDISGNIHFAYIANRTLSHAYRDENGWAIDHLATYSNQSSDPGDVMTAIGPDGTVHITYFNQDTWSLEHAYNANGTWDFEVINSATSSGSASNLFMTLAIDSNNTSYICYPLDSASSIDLYCSNNASGSWTHELVDDGFIDSTTQSKAGYHPSIYIDNDDNIHLAYFLEGYGSISGPAKSYIRYTQRVNSAWSHSTLQFEHLPDARISNIEINGNGLISLFMLDDDTDKLDLFPMHMDHITWDGSVWSRNRIFEALGSRFSAGTRSDIVTDQNGFSHIIYVSDTHAPYDQYFYANNLAGTWITETLASYPQNSYIKPAIAVDNNGFIHIVIAQQNGSDIGTFYLTNASGVWRKEIVSAEFIGVGKYSIKVDARGLVHISYLSNGLISRLRPWQLRYANNSSGNWTETQIYEYSDTDIFEVLRNDAKNAVVELAIDSNNTVFIAFIRRNHLLLAEGTQASWSVNSILDATDDIPYYFVDALYETHINSPSITFDKNFDLHLAYEGIECRGGLAASECLHAGLRHSKFSSNAWEHSLVDAELYYIDFPHFVTLYPTQPNIKISNTGKIYIAYYHHAYEHMRVAEIADTCLVTSTEVEADLNLWTNESREYFLDPSLSIQPNGSVSISYFDKSNGALKYAASDTGLDVEFCITEPASPESLLIDVVNRSLDPINVEDLFLLTTSGGSIVTNGCLDQLINPDSSCSIETQINEPIVPSVSGIMVVTNSDPISQRSNTVFVRMPEIAASDTEDPPSTNSQNSNSGGGGAFSFTLLALISIFFRRVARTGYIKANATGKLFTMHARYSSPP